MRWIVRVLMLVVLAGGMEGCRDRDDTPQTLSRKGRVSMINVATGEVEMLCFNPKKNNEQKIPGKLAPEAEILINGATARLEDVVVDDQVEVSGRVEKTNGNPQFVATKVQVTRKLTATIPSSAPQSATAP